jgi:GrpB-like predicted nucleotidyltransferase (UPF0157 family)
VGGSNAAATVALTTEATATGRDVHQSHSLNHRRFDAGGQVEEQKYVRVKEETHAARWGQMRGYSGKTTKWVDFVMTNSTRREFGHVSKIMIFGGGVKS